MRFYRIVTTFNKRIKYRAFKDIASRYALDSQ